jgi:hypothetical protein
VRNIFGDDDALYDGLLNDCYVEQSNVYYRPILIGKWGIGKSAIALHCVKPLDDTIKKYTKSKKDERMWYIGESTINRSRLTGIKSDNELALIGDLENLWKAEIIRTECILLATLYIHYNSPTGEHWDTVKRIASSEENLRTVWDRIPEVFSIITGRTSESVVTIQESLQEIVAGKALNAIETCLDDIANEPIQPILMIEPIDTPQSGLENDEGIAQAVVTSLLNVYYREFLKSQSPTQWLRICIPWHRWKPDRLDYPQKIQSYTTDINWCTDKLREFINSRIQWEFKHIGRKPKSIDFWSQLFSNNITNGACTPEITEDCFLYFLRHTHHRPRDLQRMARLAVQNQASSSRISIDEVLFGKDGLKVNEKNIRNAIKETCELKMRNEFFNELRRKYSKTDILYVKDLVTGISVPFELDDLKQRHKDLKGSDIKPGELINLAEKLWESGLIGVEINPCHESIRDLMNFLGMEGFRKYILKGGDSIAKWFFFEYNWNQSPFVLKKRFESEKDGKASFVLHPSTFEFLLPTVDKTCPIGA